MFHADDVANSFDGNTLDDTRAFIDLFKDTFIEALTDDIKDIDLSKYGKRKSNIGKDLVLLQEANSVFDDSSRTEQVGNTTFMDDLFVIAIQHDRVTTMSAVNSCMFSQWIVNATDFSIHGMGGCMFCMDKKVLDDISFLKFDEVIALQFVDKVLEWSKFEREHQVFVLNFYDVRCIFVWEAFNVFGMTGSFNYTVRNLILVEA